ncbi:MAG: efflux RND transporter permease subunit [Pseudomonadota bacterium]
MTRLLSRAAANPVLANILMAGLVIAGLAAAFQITIRNFPEINLGAVQIAVSYPGATPQEVVDAIVVPIEGRVRSVDGIRRLTAEARTGEAIVTATLDRGVDVRTVLDDIDVEIGAIAIFPQDAETPIVSEVEAPELAIQFILSGDVPMADLKDLAFSIREEMLALRDITSVDLSGAPPDQIDILVSQRTLDAYGLGLSDLALRVADQSLDLSGGTLISERERVQLRTAGEAQTGAEFAALPILSSADGAVLTLGALADVRDGLADEGVVSLLDGKPAIYITVNREGDQQILEIVETMRNLVATSVAPRLPETVTITEWRNEAELLTGRIDLLLENAAIGAALILALLALTLEARVAFWVLLGIATAFTASFSLMQVFGVTINQLSLFGFILALGVVVDDAIVVGESIFACRARGDEALKATQRGVGSVAAPVIYAVGTTICAFVPLLLLPGVPGSFVAPVAAVVILVLIFSLVDSLLILPHHLAGVSARPPRRFSPLRLLVGLRRVVGGGIDAFAETRVRRMARLSVAQPIFVILICFGVFVASLALLSSGKVGFVFFPDIEGDYVAATVEMPEGTSEAPTLRRAEEVAAAARRAAVRIADETGDEGVLRGTAIAIGFAVAVGDPEGGGRGASDRASVEARILGAERRRFSAERFVALWREEASDVPGILRLSFSASVVPIGADVALEVGAASDDARSAAVARITKGLRDRPGILSVVDSDATTSQEAVFVPGETARSIGVSVSDVARELRRAVFGERAVMLQRDEEEVDVRVRLPEAERADVTDLADYRIRVGEARVPLSTLGTFAVTAAPTTITRINGRRITSIEAEVDDAVSTGSAEIAFLRAEVLPDIQARYPDVTLELSGEAQEEEDFGPALAVNFGLALFVIYALLALALRSYVQPVLVLLVVPFGFMGALAGHALMGLDLTLLSVFGIVGLAGIVINGALLLMATANRLRDEGMALREAIIESVVARFRPILLTTLTTFLGIAPLISETSIQAQFLIPTAVSLGAGIVLGSFFVLLIVPAYLSLVHATALLLTRRVLQGMAEGR